MNANIHANVDWGVRRFMRSVAHAIATQMK
jgi:hypothetical protein